MQLRSHAWIVSFAAGLIGGTCVAHADPSDPFGGIPNRETEAPRGNGTAPPTPDPGLDGSASYSFPIDIPPGRNGMVPRLALDYSSAGELRGGVAVGWTLGLPHIERDPRYTGSTAVYIADIGGASGHLVSAPDTVPAGTLAFRFEHDASFARFEATTSGDLITKWTVRTPDGHAIEFDGTGLLASDAKTRWNITRERDADGNQVDYAWQIVSSGPYVDWLPSAIQYTSNPQAGLAAFAKVDFTYAPLETCLGSQVPIGARVSHRLSSAFGLHGARRLTDVITSVRDTPAGPWRQVRDVKLTYDAAAMACGRTEAPLRYLTRIDQTAGGSTLPPVTFAYGPTAPTWSAQKSLGRVSLGGYSLIAGTSDGPTAELRDMDGDGIVDGVWIEQRSDGCYLHVQRGQPGGGFDTASSAMKLPSAAWNVPGMPSSIELCTLTKQRAYRSKVICNPIGDTCVNSVVEIAYDFVDWDGDGRTDVLAGVWSVKFGNTIGGTFAPPGGVIYQDSEIKYGTDAQCHGAGGNVTGHVVDAGNVFAACACPAGESWGESMLGDLQCLPDCWMSNDLSCVGGGGGGGGPGGGGGGGLHPDDFAPPGPEPGTTAGTFRWHAFVNDGAGFLATTWAFDAPAPLSPAGGETQTSVLASRPAPPLIADLDGDGLLDVLTTPRGDAGLHVDPARMIGGPATSLLVFAGDAHGVTPPTSWTIPAYASDWEQFSQFGPFGTATIGGLAVPQHVITTSQLALQDLDGDGFPDLVVSPVDASDTPLGLAALWNGGERGFSLTQLRAPSTTNPARFAGAALDHQADLPIGWESGDRYRLGQRGARQLLIDVDGDGIADHVDFLVDTANVQTTNARAMFAGLGDGFATAATLPIAWDAAKRIIVAQDDAYAYRSDVLDVTGDGIPDLVSIAADGSVTIRTEPAGEAPPRLLLSVDNGRGARTTFSYATSTDPSVVALGGRPLPSPRWVVKQIATSPGASQPTKTVRYAYAAPLRGSTSAYEAPTHFLGFASVTTDELDSAGAVGRRTLRNYASPFVNAAPRLHDETLLANPAPGAALAATPVRVTSHEYTSVPIFDGRSTFVYESRTTEHTCMTGDTASACATGSWNAVVRDETWSPYALPAGTGLYLHTSSAVRGSPFAGRRTKRSYQVFESATERHLVQIGEDQQLTTLIGGAEWGFATLARTTFEDLDAHHHPWSTVVWLTLDRASTAITTHAFDGAGNVVVVLKPNQRPVGAVTTIAHDAFDLYPTTTTDELGHVVKARYDLGTGVLIERDGPNARTYTPPCNATPCPQVTQLEPETWVVDGFGRVLSHGVPADPASGGGYATFVAETTTYRDDVIPNQRVTRTLLGYTGSAARTSTEKLDGLGRVVERSDAGATGAPRVTSYGHDARGALATITQPDPRNDAASVVYRYTRDGLGRATAFTRPDGTSSSMTYGALDVLVQEVSNHPGDGQGRRTRYAKDLLGRLAQVVEYDNPAPGALATTSYTYDALDRPTQITDADGTTTVIAFDFGGRRTEVTRGARTWRYGYDGDGNVISRTTPIPANGTATTYTSTTTYDPLDRVASHTPAPRDLTAARQQQLGIGTVVYKYDLGPNGIGQLSEVDFPFGKKTFAYDAHHHRFQDVWRLQIAGATSFGAMRGVTRSFTPSGLVTAEKWEDGSQWQTLYDALDRPVSVQWYDPAQLAWRDVATYARSLAGPPRTRTIGYGQLRQWTYDVLGRVVADRITLTAGGIVKSARTYGYDGFGELRTITGDNDGIDAGAMFTYDAVHRLTAAEGPGAYTATLAYSAAGNITRATIAGVDGAARDAAYHYGAVDPQAVDSLTVATTGAPLATLTYDPAGNVIQKRRAAGATESFTWDGDDVLREAVEPGGTTRYWYDETGARMVAIGPADVTLWTGSNETRFSTSGVQTLRWMTLAAGEVVGRVENKTDLELVYADALGSTMLALDRSGATQGSFLYGAFGEVVAQTGADSHPVQFDGKQTDAATGLRYYGARYYDPLLLRWTSADPLYRVLPETRFEQPQRGNWYAFTLNNPIRYVDPDGRDAEDPVWEPETQLRSTLYVEQGATTDVDWQQTFSLGATQVTFATHIEATTEGAVLFGNTSTERSVNKNAADELVVMEAFFPGDLHTSVGISDTTISYQIASSETETQWQPSLSVEGPGLSANQHTTGNEKSATEYLRVVPVPRPHLHALRGRDAIDARIRGILGEVRARQRADAARRAEEREKAREREAEARRRRDCSGVCRPL